MMVLTHLLFVRAKHFHRVAVRCVSCRNILSTATRRFRRDKQSVDATEMIDYHLVCVFGLHVIHRLLAPFCLRIASSPSCGAALLLFCKTRASDSSISFPRNGLFTITDVTQPHTRHPQGSYLRRLLHLPSRWKSHRPVRRYPTRLGIPTSCGGVAWESDTAPSCPCSSSAFSPSLASE